MKRTFIRRVAHRLLKFLGIVGLSTNGATGHYKKNHRRKLWEMIIVKANRNAV